MKLTVETSPHLSWNSFLNLTNHTFSASPIFDLISCSGFTWTACSDASLSHCHPLTPLENHDSNCLRVTPDPTPRQERRIIIVRSTGFINVATMAKTKKQPRGRQWSRGGGDEKRDVNVEGGSERQKAWKEEVGDTLE